MEIGVINIFGQIGNTIAPDGTIVSKGVELIDVVEQYSALGPDVEAVEFRIDSPGGYVEIGSLIADFISSLGTKAITVALNECMSIATKIHLAAPLQNRYIQSNCKYMIHNPFMQGVTGDAETLKKIATDVEAIETDLEKMYAKATGLDKATVSGLMKSTTFLTADQCVNMKFASKIIPAEVKAVALFLQGTSTVTNNIDMNKPTASAVALQERLKASSNIILGKANPRAVAIANRQALAANIETDKGIIVTPFVDIMEGDPATDEAGNVLEDGTYTVSAGTVEIFLEGQSGEGTVIEVAGGVITKITKPEAAPADPPAQDNAELLQKIADLEAKNADLTASAAALESEKAELAKVAEQAVNKVEQLASAYAAPQAMGHFTRNSTAPTTGRNEVTKESLNAKLEKLGKK